LSHIYISADWNCRPLRSVQPRESIAQSAERSAFPCNKWPVTASLKPTPDVTGIGSLLRPAATFYGCMLVVTPRSSFVRSTISARYLWKQSRGQTTAMQKSLRIGGFTRPQVRTAWQKTLETGFAGGETPKNNMILAQFWRWTACSSVDPPTCPAYNSRYILAGCPAPASSSRFNSVAFRFGQLRRAGSGSRSQSMVRLMEWSGNRT
jgi:hypothetical protein